MYPPRDAFHRAFLRNILSICCSHYVTNDEVYAQAAPHPSSLSSRGGGFVSSVSKSHNFIHVTLRMALPPCKLAGHQSHLMAKQRNLKTIAITYFKWWMWLCCFFFFQQVLADANNNTTILLEMLADYLLHSLVNELYIVFIWSIHKSICRIYN